MNRVKMNTIKGTDHINHHDGICKRNDRDMYRICPSKLSKCELEDLYFSLLENNLELKRNINMYQDKVKTLSAKLQRMSAYKNGAGKDANVSKSIVDEQRDSISQLKKANACMAERIRVLNMRLCSAKQFLKRPSSALYNKATNRESFKNSSMSALNAKASDANTRVSNSTSCHFQEVNDSPEETKTVETETEFVLERHDTGKPCDGVKCKTTVEELREKIVNLQEELATCEDKCTHRIDALECLVTQLQEEKLRARSAQVASEHALQRRAASTDALRERLRNADANCNELNMELTIERRKVAELETGLKLADMSNDVTKTIEQLVEKKVEEKVKSVSCEAKAYKDDSGYTEPQDVNKSVVEDQTNNRVYQELVNQIADLQSQLDMLRIYVAGDSKIITRETKSNKATDFVPYGGEMKDVDISSQINNDKPTEFKPYDVKTTADYISQDLTNEQPAQCAFYDVDTMDADDILSHLNKSPTTFKPYEVESKKYDSNAYELKSYSAETMEPNDTRLIHFKSTETQSQQKDNDIHCQIPSHVHQNPDRTDQKKESKNIKREPSIGKQTISIEEHNSCGNSSVNIIIEAKTTKRCSLRGSQTKKSIDEKAGKIRKSYSEERTGDSPKIKERFVKNLGRQSLDEMSIKISDDIVDSLMTKSVDKRSTESKDLVSPEIKNDLAKDRNYEGPGKSTDFESNGEKITDDEHKPQTISPRAKIIVKEYAQGLLSRALRKNVSIEKKPQSIPTAIQSTKDKERKNTGAYAPPYREPVNTDTFNEPEMHPTVSVEREKAQDEVSAVGTQMEGIDESLADTQADSPAAPNRRDSATYTADAPKTYSISDRHSRTTSADNTEDEIPSLAEWAKDVPGRTPQHSCGTQAMSPGEEEATRTSTDPYADVYVSLSEGEMPGGDLSVGERPAVVTSRPPTLENHHAAPESMEATLQSISEELARCRRLLHSQRTPEVILRPSVK